MCKGNYETIYLHLCKYLFINEKAEVSKDDDDDDGW